MSQIKPIRYELCIINDAVDDRKNESGTLVNEIVKISYNAKTDIKHGSKEMSLSLFGLSFQRKVYEPGHIEAEVQVSIDNSGAMPTIAELRTIFLKKKVQLNVFIGEDRHELASNYYIHEISPLIEKTGTSTSIYLKFNIYSLDNLMRIDKFSEVYLARQLRGYIVTEGVKDYVLKAGNNTYSIDLSGTGDSGDSLQNLVYEGEEFTQPYLVQYNEHFYDFVTRVANRCGEFVYFEDGKLHVGLDKATLDDADNAPLIDQFSRLTYQYIGDGVLNVIDYAHDSMKSENPEPDKALEAEPDTSVCSKANVLYVKERGIYPDVSSDDVPKKVYNTEYAADEFFVPLYRDQFSKGLIMEYAIANGGSLFVNLLCSLGLPTLFDIIVDNAAQAAMTFTKAAIYGDKANEVGNSAINAWVGKEDKKAVPFADPERRMWTTLRYFSDIKSNEEKMQRQMVCVDMGLNILVKKGDDNKPLKIGDIVKISGDDRKFMVVGIEIHGDQPWQRNYEGYDEKLSDTIRQQSADCRLKFYAIPMAEDDKFYPPVLPGGVFRHSEPQHAIVIDSDDPKLQGRVRIRYPWQPDCKSKKAAVKTEIDDLKKELEDDEKTDDEKKDITKKILSKEVEAIQLEAATPWIRMATPMATRGGGVLFKPEPYDEVLVDFEHGNIERPYVVGALYSKNTPAPDSLLPKVQYRIIRSPNGHSIMLEDPTDGSKLLGGFLPGINLLKSFGLEGALKIDLSSKEEDSINEDLVLGMARGLLGGITMTDQFGLYRIAMSTHDRKVEIASSLGKVTIDALTGISINAPKGDIKICGKNIDIEAGNRVSIKSGTNIAGPKVEINAASMAKAVATQLDKHFGELIDISFIRSIAEIILAPVNGTLQIKSKSFLVLEAGAGTAEIPVTAYQERYLADKNISYNSSGYQVLQYVLATVSGEIDECAKKFATLYNEAAGKLADVHVESDIGKTSPFNDGMNLITSMSTDDFVQKCFEERHFYEFKITLNMKLGLEWARKEKAIAKKIELAYKALSDLKKYCDGAVGADLFKHFTKHDSYAATKFIESKTFSKLNSAELYRLLEDTFKDALDLPDFQDIDWLKKIKEINNKTGVNYGYFVGDNFAARTVDAANSPDYNSMVKRFKRYMLYHILGDTGHGFAPAINNVKLFRNRNIQISAINEQPVVQSTNDIIENDNSWAQYANSLVLADTTSEGGFLGTLASELVKKLDDKLLSLSPESKIWKSDVKGKILMSDSTDTISFEHPAAGGVSLKAEGNTQFDKKTVAEASKYISRLLTDIAG